MGKTISEAHDYLSTSVHPSIYVKRWLTSLVANTCWYPVLFHPEACCVPLLKDTVLVLVSSNACIDWCVSCMPIETLAPQWIILMATGGLLVAAVCVALLIRHHWRAQQRYGACCCPGCH